MTEALLSSLPTICQKAWQTWHCLLPPTHSQNMTEALPELGYKAAGLGSLLINIWWILNHSSVSEATSPERELGTSWLITVHLLVRVPGGIDSNCLSTFSPGEEALELQKLFQAPRGLHHSGALSGCSQRERMLHFFL